MAPHQGNATFEEMRCLNRVELVIILSYIPNATDS